MLSSIHDSSRPLHGRAAALALVIVFSLSAVSLVRISPAQDSTAPVPESTPLAQESSQPVLVARIEDQAITPVTSGFIERALREGLESNATCIVIELDTPGGLLESTRTIVKDLIASRIPVVVYVAPSGARAASAGVFITMAAHVAAMAPATHIGAAHPVQMGPSPGQTPDTQQDETAPSQTTMEEKILNDTVAWIRSIAELKGRNADWAERSVTESESITGSEAVELGVVDLIAADLVELLRLLNGRTVELESGTSTLKTEGARIVHLEMWWGEEVLSVLSNPNIAFLLLMLGFYGLMFEFYSPGWGLSGTLGAICIILAFFGLAVLPINFAGLALIFIGIGLFVAEAFFTSFGILTVGGAVCLILGGIMLVDSPMPVMRISLSVLIPVAIASAVIAFFLVSRVVKAMQARVQTGTEGLLAESGIALDRFDNHDGKHRGSVKIHGEIWRAESALPLMKGDRVDVLSRTDLTLQVKKSPEKRSSTDQE